MRFSVVILAWATAAAACPPAEAQSPPPAAAGVEAAAETAARKLLAAINGPAGDRARFVSGAFSTKALQNEAAESRLKRLNKLAADTSGLTIASIQSSGERMVEAIVRSNRGGRFGKFVLFTSGAEPGKISDLFLLPARDPAKVKAEAWPTGPLPETRIAAEIEKRAAALAAEDNFSGVVLVAKNAKVLVKRAYGFADQQWRIANRADTAFHLGSVPKMFTAAAIMKLAAAGKLSLDDPLTKWVPEYPSPDSSRITLRHLLTHSAGIGPWDGRQFRKPLTGAEAAVTMTAPSSFAPGTRFEYSNAGFVLLGAVIEKATSKPLETALEELVFEPAGMRLTGHWPVTAIVPNRATGYLRPEDDPLGIGPRFSNEQFLGFGADGSGGGYSAADDMLAFLSALGSGQLLGRESTKEMLTPRIDFAGAPRPSKYGYGVDLGTCGGQPIFGHEGGGPNSGVSALTYRTLDTGWTIIVLSNYDPPAAGDLAFAICEFVANR